MDNTLIKRVFHEMYELMAASKPASMPKASASPFPERSSRQSGYKTAYGRGNEVDGQEKTVVQVPSEHGRGGNAGRGGILVVEHDGQLGRLSTRT